MSAQEPIIYEQPINEHIRVCLRLEHLFSQLMHSLRGNSPWDSRAALAALLEILNVLDRPDLKAKFVKELGRYINVLNRFAEIPHIDRTKLVALQHELEQTVHQLHATQGRVAQALRENDFLTSIRTHLLSPGGGCSFDTPVYHRWLQQSSTERIAQLTHWLGHLKIMRSAVELTLRLIRQSAAPQKHIAQEGFYQSALDAQTPCQMVRIIVSPGLNVYPETSLGRHGLSIRFYELNLIDRPTQTAHEIKFLLTLCVF